MVESVAIMVYLTTVHGPTALAPQPGDARFATYQQFLVMGEAGLMMPSYVISVSGGQTEAGGAAGVARQVFQSRLGLVRRQVAQAPYLAGEAFTAADISVVYALEHAARHRVHGLDRPLRDYVARCTARAGYRRAMAACPATRDWVAGLSAG
jgi:glutathione S-transferase